GRLDVELLADLAHRGPITPALDLGANELVDLLLSFGELTEIRHVSTSIRKDGSGITPASGRTCSPSNRRSTPIHTIPQYIRRAYTMKEIFLNLLQKHGIIKRCFRPCRERR